jgi:hypothetical protein
MHKWGNVPDRAEDLAKVAKGALWALHGLRGVIRIKQGVIDNTGGEGTWISVGTC